MDRHATEKTRREILVDEGKDNESCITVLFLAFAARL